LDRTRAAARLCAGFAFSEVPVAQLSLTTKKLLVFAPVIEMEVMPSDVLPVLESVKVCEVLAAPTVKLPKSWFGGVSVACGTEATAVPLPESTTVRGDPGWLRSWIE